MIEILRLLKDKSELAARAVNEIKPPSERNNRNVSVKYMNKFLKDKTNIFLLSSYKNKSIGYLLAYKLDRIDRDENMVLVYEINVVKSFRRRHAAKSLIEKIKEYCEKNKVYKMWVLTDMRNEPAINLYTSTGGKRIYDDGILFEYRFK